MDENLASAAASSTVEQPPAAPRILLAFATRHGSTREVAEAIAEELRTGGAEVDVREVKVDPSAARYDAVILGGPMIMGWHRGARRYLRRHQAELAARPTLLFMTAMSLTDAGDATAVPVYRDPWLVKDPASPGRLSFRERFTSISHYLDPVTAAAPAARLEAVAFFAGSLDFTRMNLLEKLFVTLVVGAKPGDGRNWNAIRTWAREQGGRLRAG